MRNGILLVSALFAAGNFLPAASTDDRPVREAYERYRAAVAAADVAALKQVIADARRAELDAEDAEAKLAIAAALAPTTPTITAVTITGTQAKVELSAPVEGATAAGVVELVQERGTWKVSTESWNVQIGATATAAAPGSPEPQPAPAPAPASDDGDATGEMQLVKDGAALTYPLKTGFRFKTRLKAPTHGTIHFGPPPSDKVGSFHGVMLTVDATQAGMHYADGDEIRAAGFDRDKLEIGTPGREGRKAMVIYYAEGGQMFMPKTGCAIEVVSPYTGDAASVMEGRIAECTVHSAGIDYRLSSVRFTVRGVSLR